MIEAIRAALASGEMPPREQLRRWLDTALIKKLGVLKQPYPVWPADPKINPPALLLLAAAVMLEDREAYLTVCSVIELEETAKGKRASSPRERVEELLASATTSGGQEKLRQKLRAIAPQVV